MIRAAIFDLDGTLFDRATSVHRCIEAQYRRHAESLKAVSAVEFVEKFLELDARGYTPKDVVYAQLVEQFSLQPGMQTVLFDDFYAYYHSHAVGFFGLHEMLDELHRAGLRLGIITNGRTTHQLATIRALDLESKFDAILISEREGVRKPAAEIFRRALDLLSADAGETVYVGDHPAIDIEGARSAGLWTIWKKDPFWGECESSHASVEELSELPPLLGSWPPAEKRG